MNVALIQLNAGINKQQNIQNTCANVEKAIDKGAEFILLPEIFNYRGPLTGIDLFNEIAEEIPGESLIPLMELAKNAGVNILAGSIYERPEKGNKVYNTSVIINDSGDIICKYRKINLFRAIIDGKEVDESNIYEAGDKSVTCKLNNMKVGLSICFDLRFPELYREYFNEGVDMIVIPSSFTSKTGKLHWEALLRARAIENYCYVLAPNQFGIDGNGVETYGHSMTIDPQGKVISVLKDQEEGILISNLSFENQSYIPIINQ